MHNSGSTFSPTDTPVHEALDRLEASFGRKPVHALLRGLAEQLDAAMKSLDQGEAAPAAHRIAGVAGTLGFAALGRAWLSLSEGEDAAREPARAETLAALSIVASRLRSAGEPSTSV